MPFHKTFAEKKGWETLNEAIEFANPFIEVRSTDIKTPSRPEARNWTVVHRKAACVVAPITEQGEFLLIRQERIPIRAAIWEFPAGQIDETSGHDDRAIRDTALRELREETGYELAPGAVLIPMGLFFSSPGFTDEHGYIFLARPVVRSNEGHAHDSAEAILDCRAFSPEIIRKMIAENVIRDANTLAAWARIQALGLL